MDARFLHEKLSALRGVGSLNNMLETIVQEKPVMRRSVLNPNGVMNSPGVGTSSPTSGTPRPRGSIDLDGLQKTTARQNSTGATNAMPNNLAARPSPFARRGLASLFGGASANASTNASASSLNLVPESGVITREGSPAPGFSSRGAMQIGSSGGATPNREEGRASPPPGPSPPQTPGTNSISPPPKETNGANLNQGDGSNTVEPENQEGAITSGPSDEQT